MKVLCVHQCGAPLELEDVPNPIAGSGEVVVRNLATSLDPIDQKKASGAKHQAAPLIFPWIPGGDVAGVIASLGAGVSGFEPGDAVFGYNPDGGAYAEEVLVKTSSLAHKPPTLSFDQAAAVALVSQTAAQMLEFGKVSKGKRVLVHGGAGGVGSLAIQLARAEGAEVVTTAHEEQREVLIQLGAQRVIDFTKERFEDLPEPFDVVLALIGGDTLTRSYSVVKRGGVLVTSSEPPDSEQCAKLGIAGFFVQTEVTTDGLNRFAAQVTSGLVVPMISTVESLWDPHQLWAKRESVTAVGKVVFTLGSNA